MAHANVNEAVLAPVADGLGGFALPDSMMVPSVTTTNAARTARFVWLGRSRRVLLALAAVWVLNVFDLCFTIREAREPHFVEVNPVAANLLGGPEHWLIVYKVSLVGAGSAILLILRKHSITELATWFLMAVSVYVAARWYVYFECLVDDRYSPFITAAIGS